MCTYTGVLSKGKIFAMLQCGEKSINATCKCSLTRSRQYQIPEHVFKKSIITHPIVYIIQISYCVAINSAHCVWKRSIAATWSMKLVDHKPLQNNFLRQSTLKKRHVKMYTCLIINCLTNYVRFRNREQHSPLKSLVSLQVLAGQVR